MKYLVGKYTLIIICFYFFSSFSVQQSTYVEKVYAKMVSRQLQANKTITLKSEICFEKNGNMVTHFTNPAEYVVVTNKTGEIKVYDPEKNTVIVKQASIFSSQSSQFYYFLTGNTNDFGLSSLGFVPIKTYPEGDLIISEWVLKTPDSKSQVQLIKLVHKQQVPIYMEYKDKAKTTIRKVYYYAYNKFNNFTFPTTTTEIVYNSASDSVITKTVYSDFKFNAEANSSYFSFKVPNTAKKIN
jgi:outer membrane lipoprotein-sorting protein